MTIPPSQPNNESAHATGTPSINDQDQGAKIIKSQKIDPITAVQDTIDSLSLSLFESLRGLRDAVAPESAQTGPNNTGQPIQINSAAAQTNTDPDYDSFLIAYHNDEPEALELVAKADGRPPRTKEEYLKLLSKIEMDKDITLVSRLAQEILSKSAAVDDLVSKLPGIHRTKTDQMNLIESLLEKNRKAEEELDNMYEKAESKRDEIRQMLKSVTCNTLGIEEEH
mmetsp:Transcript_12189/g.17323  ORF Transcript_12189/g.17323 Transcript_12189/m.17323 type:complete len:225 (+) Transcript_12189:2-676(+)